jgi:AraC-like DNA-binding protein
MLLLLSQIAARPVGARPDARHGAGLASAIAWLDEHCVQPVSVAELAARAGLGYRTFTAQVRRLTGESVLARILRLRLERAEVLLRRGMPVMEAAMASGFGDLSGFYRHFRRRYGMAPGTFRTRSEVR